MDIEKLKAMLEESLEKNFSELQKQIDEKIAESLDAKVESLGLNKVNKTMPAGDGGEFEAKTKIASFIKAIATGDRVAVKDMTEGTDSTGGFLVPTELYAGVMRIMEDYGLARKFATVFPMKSDTLNVPTISSSVTVYWPGEATAGTASQPVYANAALAAKTAVGLTVVSNELLEDASVSIVDHLLELFAEALASAEDDQALTGTGSPFTGILAHASVNVTTMASGVTTFAGVTLDYLRDLIAQVKSSVLPSSAFIMHRTIWNKVQQLTDDSKHVSTFFNPIVSMNGALVGAGNGAGLQPAGYLWGYPVYLNDQMPANADTAVSTKFIIFGSLKKGLFMGDRKQMTLKLSDSASVGTANVFEENQSAVRITERVAIVLGLPTAFAVLKTAAS